MKNIILVITVMTMYLFADAQEMKGMDMSKKEHPQKEAIKKKSNTVAKAAPNGHDRMKMPKDTLQKPPMDMDNMKTPDRSSGLDTMDHMNMTKTSETIVPGKRVEYFLNVTEWMWLSKVHL